MQALTHQQACAYSPAVASYLHNKEAAPCIATCLSRVMEASLRVTEFYDY